MLNLYKSHTQIKVGLCTMCCSFQYVCVTSNTKHKWRRVQHETGEVTHVGKRNRMEWMGALKSPALPCKLTYPRDLCSVLSLLWKGPQRPLLRPESSLSKALRELRPEQSILPLAKVAKASSAHAQKRTYIGESQLS